MTWLLFALKCRPIQVEILEVNDESRFYAQSEENWIKTSSKKNPRILYHDSGVLFVYWSRKVYSRYACIIKLKWKNTEKSLCNESYTPFDLDKPYIFGLKLILSSGARPTWPTWAGAWTAPHSTTSLSSATSTRTW